MEFSFLKECIHIEVIGEKNKFSWFRAIRRTIRNRRKSFIFWWRIACYLHAQGGFKRKIARKIKRNLYEKYALEIPFKASIAPGFGIAHFPGVVITENVKIGRNFRIKQCVTIGSRDNIADTMITIGDNVDIGCNSTILGGKITIGDNVTIGAHSLVLTDIPPNTVYTNKFSAIYRSKNIE